MKDYQNQKPEIPIPLSRVGVTNVKKRLTFYRKEPYQLFVNMTLAIKLPRYQRGANMSRFVEILDQIKSAVSLESYVRQLAYKIIEKHHCEAYVKVSSAFPYGEGAEEKFYPIECSFDTETETMTLSVSGEGMTYCPCSGHTQRCYITVTLYYSGEDEIIKAGRIIDAINESVSVPVHYVLKRPIELSIMKKASANPKFVEDVVRSLIVNLRKYPSIRSCRCRIEVRSMESIHPHDVFVEWEGIL